MSFEQELRSLGALYRAALGIDPKGVKSALLDAVAIAAPSDVIVCASFAAGPGLYSDSTSRGLSIRASQLKPLVAAQYAETIPGQTFMSRGVGDATCFGRVQRFIKKLDANLPSMEHCLEFVCRSADGAFHDLVVAGRVEGPAYSEAEVQKLRAVLYHVREADQIAIAKSLEARARINPRMASAVASRTAVLLGAHPRFALLMERHYPDWQDGLLPFALPKTVGATARDETLFVRSTAAGDRLFVDIWESSEVDLLSPRERECATGICKGLSLKEVALEMGVSPSTASTLLQRAMKKLDAKNRRALRGRLHLHPGLANGETGAEDGAV